MALRNRQTLKNYFQKGELPKEGHFEDLVDSVVNIIDDGISVSLKEGLKITPLYDKGHMISFYKKIEEDKPEWSIVLDKNNSILSINNKDDKKIISFNGEGKVGINVDEPVHELDVKGIISQTGRIGSFAGKDQNPSSVNRIPADGHWHTILDGLSGVQGFEIMAGAGKKNTGKYALLHAIALSTFGGWRSSGSIRKTQAFYRWFWHKIKIRWKGSIYDYRLEMATMSDYGENQFINYSITKLWFDEFMENSMMIETIDQSLLDSNNG